MTTEDIIIEAIERRLSLSEDDEFQWELSEDDPQYKAALENNRRFSRGEAPVNEPEREIEWMDGTIKLRWCLSHFAGTLRPYYDEWVFEAQYPVAFRVTSNGLEGGDIGGVIAHFINAKNDWPLLRVIDGGEHIEAA